MSSKLFNARRSNSKTSLVAPQFYPDSIIRLNVGGKRFDTRLRTLLADRNGPLFSMFSPLLEPGTEYKHPQKDDDGAFFLDFDPKEFRTLLNNLRYLGQFQGSPTPATFSQEPQMENKDQSMDKDDDDSRSTRSTRSNGLWSRLSKKNSVAA